MDKLEAIAIFHKVVECGSFSKASQALNLAPSTVTRNIDQLEKSLGKTLLKRSTRELALTDPGQDFLLTSRQMLDLWQQAKGEKSDEDSVSGVLRVSAVESFGRLIVAPMLGSFLAAHPNLKLEFHLDNQLTNLYQDGVDVAIRIGRPKDSQLKYRHLVANTMSLAAHPSYLAANGAPQSPTDLTDHNCLMYARQRQQAWWHCRRGDQYEKIPVSGNLSSIGGTPLVAAINQGLGIGLVPPWLRSELERDTQFLLPDWQFDLAAQGSGEIYAVYTEPSAKARAFLDQLSAHCQQLLSCYCK